MHRFEKWREMLHAASNTSAVEGVMEDYRSALPDEVLNALPPDCRRALQNSNISSAAVTLAHCELGYRGDPETAAFLHEIAHTFAVASMRMVVLSDTDPVKG